MTTLTPVRPSGREIASGLAVGLALGCFVFLVALGLSGELGRVLSGITQASPPAGSPPSSTVLWAVAAAALAAALTAPLQWRHPRVLVGARAVSALLVGALAVALLGLSLAEWAAAAAPAAVTATTYLVVALRHRLEGPHVRPQAAPLPQLGWSVALATAYGVLALIAVSIP